MNTLTNTFLMGVLTSSLLLPIGAYAHDKNQEEHKHHEHYSIDDNPRDGFYLGISAISSIGDNFYEMPHDDNETQLDIDANFRIQFLGLFVDSPGISSRRVHGLYATPAWGINFFNDDVWSLDLFHETSTRQIEGLEGLSLKSEYKRAGIRATGYFENSQLQFIFTPYSSKKGDKDGVEASVSYGYNWQHRNWNYYANVGMHYRSKEVADYVPEHGFTNEYGDFETKSGVSTSAEFGIEYPLSKDWVMGSFVSYRKLSDREKAMRTDDVKNGYRAGLLLTYVF